MKQLFDIERTVRTYGLYFDAFHDELRQLLGSVDRCLGRCLPAEVSARIDAEGSTLERADDGRLWVRRHPALEQARQQLAEMGLFRTFLPDDVGGFGLPLGIYYLASQLVAAFDSSLALVLLVHGNAMYAINRYGDDQQRARYLPALAAGQQLATVAFSEPLAGSDAGHIRTRAVRDGHDWVISGDKLFITHGGDADLLITTARTGSAAEGIDGVSAFLVERERDGVEVTGLEHKTGQSGSPTAALAYPEVRIPAHRLLGRPGKGGHVMFAGVGMTRVNIAAQALGTGKRAFAAAVNFARQRHQGGKTIINHDAVLHRLSGMVSVLSACEGLICHDSALEQRGAWHVLEMSQCKTYAAEAMQRVTLRAINVHGGYGVCREYGVERCRREVTALPLYGGTSEVHWYIIARELLGVLDGSAKADYRKRHQREARELNRKAGGDPSLQRLAATHERGIELLWRCAEQVGRATDPTPHHRRLADLSCELAAARELLRQAVAPEADTLQRELARHAVDEALRLAQQTEAEVQGPDDRHALKQALLQALNGI